MAPTRTQQASYDLARQVLADPVARAMFQRMIERTAEGEPVPDDFSWLDQDEKVWVPFRNWRLVRPDEDCICRQQRCTNFAVAALRRKHGAGSAWWHYCGDHLYGNRIIDGLVCIAVTKDSPAAERGWF